ncbi:hypothetical protein MJO29_016523 [Puccinia striiformis f. sp. tritici]|nr:hypothetical protein MJO29_016523 [Puccinia striiformis f. sp. tritici]
MNKDRDHTDSRRIEPNSRTSLISEQLNPSKLLHLEDEMSRHRGVKPFGQYELSQTINLLSLAVDFPLSDPPNDPIRLDFTVIRGITDSVTSTNFDAFALKGHNFKSQEIRRVKHRRFTSKNVLLRKVGKTPGSNRIPPKPQIGALPDELGLP